VTRGSESLVPATGELLVYVGDDGAVHVQVRLAEGTVWLTQKLMAQLYGISVPTINEHLRNIFDEEELDPGATIRKFLIVGTEGNRSVSRLVDHYALAAILAVGYRVRSTQGTRFRQWATARLDEYLVKGFVLDDERLKNPPGPGHVDYFDELLERIRDIRASERRFYQKVLDIYATSVDYQPDTKIAQRFFATVQNKMHWATHGHTAAEIIPERADAARPFMGMETTRPGGIIRKGDAAVAKNYLSEDELQVLHRIVGMYIEYAELQALERKPMTMRDWITKLDELLKISGRDVLDHAGQVSAEAAKAKAEREYARYRAVQDARPRAVDAAFEKATKQLQKTAPTRAKKPGKK
jgi:hypothetical protein